MSKSPTPQTVEDLLPDSDNQNRGTERGSGLLENVLRTLGAGRSILIDKDNNVIAGNQVLQAAVDAGLVRVKVVETNGQELVAVKRTDVALDSKIGREIATADNVIALRNIDLDAEVIARQAQAHGLDLDACGISAAELESMLAKAEQQPADVEVDALDTSKPPPVMSWVLIGIPTVRFGDIAQKVEAIAALHGVVCETTVTSDEPEKPAEDQQAATSKAKPAKAKKGIGEA